MNWTPEKIHAEVTYTDQFVRAATSGLKELISNYHGKHFGTGHASIADAANHSFDYVSIMLPQAVFNDPVVGVTSARGGAPAEVARALRAGTTRWMKDSKFLRTFERLVLDQFFFQSVALLSQRPTLSPEYIKRMPADVRKRFQEDDGGIGASMSNYGASEPSKPMWPTLSRVAPWNFGFDPACEDYAEARYAYHKFIRPRAELLAMAEKDTSWNRKAIEGAPSMTGIPTAMRDLVSGETPSRDDVVLLEFWARNENLDKDHTPDEGYNGVIYTIAVCDVDGEVGMEFVRRPRAFYGPRTGPYYVSGIYPVPNSPVRLAPLAVVQEQIRDLNTLEHSVTQSAKDYKRVLAAAASDVEDAKRLRSALHDWMVPMQSMDRGVVVEIELGGVTEQQLAQVEYMRDRLERSSGVTDAVRGNVSGVATATENAIANDAAGVRLGYVLTQVERHAQDILTGLAWYLYHDDRVVFPLAPEDFGPLTDEQRDALDGQEVWFEGGSHDRDEGYTFDDLELTIEVGSMQKRNTARRRGEFAELMAHSLSLVQAAPMFPWVRWSEIVRQLGELYDMKGWETNFDFAQAGQSLPLLSPEPKTQGQVTAPSGGAKISVNAGGGRGGAAKPPAPKAKPAARPGAK